MRDALERHRLKAIYDRVAGRYDFQHSMLTAGTDQRGRELVVEKTVTEGDLVLDAGAGTGSTALLAAKKVGPKGKVILYDMSEPMLAVAKKRAAIAGIAERMEFLTGDITSLPYDDNSFDAAVSTYSMCPLYDPARGALELYRVVKPGGFIGVAHSAEPEASWLKWLARRVEGIVWHFPSISLGCRSVSVVPSIERAGGKVIFRKQIGIALWPFLVAIIEKSK